MRHNQLECCMLRFRLIHIEFLFFFSGNSVTFEIVQRKNTFTEFAEKQAKHRFSAETKSNKTLFFYFLFLLFFLNQRNTKTNLRDNVQHGENLL